MTGIDFNIRTANGADRSRLANLIHFGSYIHQHLDWKSTLDWIGTHPFLVMERNGGLVATIACPPVLPDFTWVRLFAVSPNVQVDFSWNKLWSAAIEELKYSGKFQVAALSLQSWFNDILQRSNFTHTDNVIILLWEGRVVDPKPKSIEIEIRPILPEDLSTVAEIDGSAFSLEWKNSVEELELAYQQSSVATLAEVDGEIVGYQLSTSSSTSTHLARLAVKPIIQGRGVGYSLVQDLLVKLNKQGVMHVTVNTQQKNAASLALYEKLGFKYTGEFYRVYQYTF